MMTARTRATSQRGSLGQMARPVCAAGVLWLAVTAAYAQQGWAPTVAIGAEPRAREQVRAAQNPVAAKKKVAPVFTAASVEPQLARPVPEIEPTFTPVTGTSHIETGSTTKLQRPDDYCTSIATPAADARFAWQKKVLADLDQDIAKRIALLEEKTAEYKTWLARRDEFSQKANETLLRIYTRMKPDAAAAQLAEFDEETAAAVLTKLEPRVASLILNEVPAAKAARLTAVISGAAKIIPTAARPATKATQ